jgi:hypothetical protein
MRQCSIFTWLLFLPLLVSGQTHELGFGLGGMYYQGDINPERPFQQSQLAYQVFYRKNFDYHWSIRAGGVIGKVSGDDSLGTYDFQANRNLRFESDIYEGFGWLEFNFLPFRPGRTNKGGVWTPFIFAGLSLFYFSPQVNYNGSLVDLASLNTEGQNLPGSTLGDYGFLSMAVPFGAGIKLKLSNRFSLMGEWGMRMTFTDYLDDISYQYPNQAQMVIINGQLASELSDPSLSGTVGGSTLAGYQRGTSNNLDWYSFFNVSLVFKFNDPKICYMNGL